MHTNNSIEINRVIAKVQKNKNIYKNLQALQKYYQIIKTHLAHTQSIVKDETLTSTKKNEIVTLKTRKRESVAKFVEIITSLGKTKEKTSVGKRSTSVKALKRVTAPVFELPKTTSKPETKIRQSIKDLMEKLKDWKV